MKPVKVLVVDDSAYSRRIISKILDGIPGVTVVGYASDGEDGIRQTISLKPDLVTIDLEMPRMDGFTLLRILTSRFNLPVIVVSALSQAEKVFKALELGAVDFVAKPTTEASTELLSIRNDLQQKVRQAVNARVINYSSIMHDAKPEVLPVLIKKGSKKQEIELLAIAASTGGPPALQGIFNAFERPYPFAILVAQHMPAGFTGAFAERLNRSSSFEVREAVDGDMIKPGLALVAPGGQNMVVSVEKSAACVRLVPPDPKRRYIPSADELFISAAKVYGKRMLALVLTGMGNDGSNGVRAVKESGGTVLSESEQSSVVYGMPREAYATGCVDKVANLPDIPMEILALGGFEPEEK